MTTANDPLFDKYIDNMACYYNIGIIYKIINSDLKLKANPRLKDLLFKYEEYKENNKNYIKINGYYRELKGEYYLDLKRILCSLFNPNDNGDKKKKSFLDRLMGITKFGSLFSTKEQIGKRREEREEGMKKFADAYFETLEQINNTEENINADFLKQAKKALTKKLLKKKGIKTRL
tara:strand:- start:10500 stop:11027 length:528 start_codon:yes stop_codon:yes gene_type:complete